ncbi:hypothetical protein [Flavobacterium sp. JP2137]|uniref:hypothetical protein n=1 Tax=Flavobacterium sp. JP2137 TaxID=3414510 RepID=UPI003D2FEC2F
MRTINSLLLLLVFASSCAQKNDVAEVLYAFPKSLKEVSGMHLDSNNLLWVVEDSGNKNELYALDSTGKLQKTLRITNATNHDWEDLTYDAAENLYIGDFGNNGNERQNLKILKIDKQALQNAAETTAEEIAFYYPEQEAFPPKKSEFLYDAEAFFVLGDSFYIFTKNRSKGFDGSALVYRVPNQPGRHAATLIGTFKTCGVYSQCAITSAAISPDLKTIAVLTQGKVWLIENFDAKNILSGKVSSFNLNHLTQKESILFQDNQTLLLSDEAKKKQGGQVYRIDLKDLKSKS